MQFKLKKDLLGGRFYVRVEMTEFDENDKSRSVKFGIPTLTIRTANGSAAQARVSILKSVEPFGFYTQEEADQYAEELKKQIIELKARWNALDDTWSDEETL